jgi:hypothetical protein
VLLFFPKIPHKKERTLLLFSFVLFSFLSLLSNKKIIIMSGGGEKEEEEASSSSKTTKVAPGHRSLFSRVSTFGSDLVNALGDGIN